MAQITDHSEKDATLLLGFRQGDAASLRQLLTRYRREIHYFTWSILKDRQTADEIVNDAFLKVWKVRAEFASLAQIRSYLYVVSKNECLNFLKSPRGRRLEHIDSVAHLLHSEESIETHMMHSELLSAVYDEVQKLPKKQRRVFQLAFFEGLSTEEISRSWAFRPMRFSSTNPRRSKPSAACLREAYWLIHCFTAYPPYELHI